MSVLPDGSLIVGVRSRLGGGAVSANNIARMGWHDVDVDWDRARTERWARSNRWAG